MKPSYKTKTAGGIRSRLLASLAMLTFLVLLVVWIFQVFLLGFFYEREKFEDMKTIAAELREYEGAEGLARGVLHAARDKDVCIRVMQRSGDVLIPFADADITGECVIHQFGEEEVLEWYRKTADTGSYSEKVRVRTRTDSGVVLPGIRHKAEHAIHAEIFEKDGKEYFLLLDFSLLPVDAVLRTVRTQLTWIVLILLLLVVAFAFFLSYMITKPLSDITENAKRLAVGKYRPHAVKKGYKEVRELSDALDFAAEEISAADRLQKELVANVSHDLRTPLTMIKGYSEVMRDIPGENTPENVQIIIDETARLSDLVNDILDLSKLQSGTKKPETAVFDIDALVRDTMERYKTLIAREGYHIEYHSQRSAFVEADRTMILQVIYNLINNAVNYTGESRRVTVREEIRGERVRISVADEGKGIPPESIPDIFDRYYRVDKVHKRAVKGSGLGLSIVKSVLEAHPAATYGVDSALGVGSVFWFELPIKEPPEEN